MKTVLITTVIAVILALATGAVINVSAAGQGQADKIKACMALRSTIMLDTTNSNTHNIDKFIDECRTYHKVNNAPSDIQQWYFMHISNNECVAVDREFIKSSYAYIMGLSTDVSTGVMENNLGDAIIVYVSGHLAWSFFSDLDQCKYRLTQSIPANGLKDE